MRRRRKLLDRLLTAAAALAGLVSLGLLAGLVASVAIRGGSALSPDLVLSPTREAGAAGGVREQLLGTALLVLTAAAFAVPVAAGAGLALATLLGPRARRALETALHALNGVPSIVHGLFGLVVFCGLCGLGKSWLAGGLVLGLMIVPTVAVAFHEKLAAIPRSTLEAARGLGLSPAQMIPAVLVPHGASGLLTGTLLGLARAAGETAPLLFTAAVFSGASFPTGIVESPVLALPYHVFVLAQDALDPRAAERLWASALLLLLFVGVLSALTLPLRIRAHEEAGRV